VFRLNGWVITQTHRREHKELVVQSESKGAVKREYNKIQPFQSPRLMEKNVILCVANLLPARKT